MSNLDHLAETIKLARLLGVDEARLAFLAPVDATAMRVLRERLATTFVEDTRPMLQRAVKASRLLPVGMLASIGERVMGAVLCSRMAGMMDPGRAVEVSMRMRDAFLADVSAMLEPRRAQAVIAAVPRDKIVAVAKVLAERKDFVTLARFVGYLADDTIRAVIEAVPDDDGLLRTAFFLESKATLDRLVVLVPAERLRAVVRLVARSDGSLWAEALALLTHLGADWQRMLGDLAVSEAESALGAMIATIERFALWPQVIPLIAALSEASQRRLLALPEVRQPSVTRAIVHAAEASGMWRRLLPLVHHMDEALRRDVGREVQALAASAAAGRAEVEAALARALDGGDPAATA